MIRPAPGKAVSAARGGAPYVSGTAPQAAGASVIFGWTYNQCKPNDVIWNQNYGHIGTGLPYATGAMLVSRNDVTRITVAL